MRKKKNKNKILKKKSIEDALKNQKDYKLGSLDPESILVLNDETRKKFKEKQQSKH